MHTSLRITERVCLAVALSLAACAEEHLQPPAPAVPTRLNYAPGAWRLQPQTVNDVVLPFAHILIAHRENGSEIGGTEADWFWLPARPSRSRTDALARAAELERRLAAGEPFEALAAKYSDDVVTARRGGVVGMTHAPTLPEPYLDALAVLWVGEVSEVVETTYGFSVLKRLPLPADQLLSAQALVVKYQGTGRKARTGKLASRTRDQARALADQLLQLARRDPQAFSTLVERYSDGRLARGGDIGVWSAREPFISPPALHVLGKLREGELSDVLDTPIGFTILRRQAVAPRPSYAANEIAIAYTGQDELVAGVEIKRSRAEADALATRILRELSQDPSRFDALRREHCDSMQCEQAPRAWWQSRGDRSIETIVERLRIGEVASVVADTEIGLLIVRREDEVLHAPAEASWRFEIPTVVAPPPPPPSLDVIVKRESGATLREAIGDLKTVALAEMDLTDAEAARFGVVLDTLAQRMESAPVGERAALIERGRSELQALLGPRRFEQFQGIRRRFLGEESNPIAER